MQRNWNPHELLVKISSCLASVENSCNPMDCNTPGCPPLSTGVCSNSCPLSQWCYLTISRSAAPFFFCPQSFPASGSFPILFINEKKRALGGSDNKESACNAGDMGSIPGSGKIPWRKKWQPTPVFLTGKCHGQRSLMGYSPWGGKSRTWLSN